METNNFFDATLVAESEEIMLMKSMLYAIALITIYVMGLAIASTFNAKTSVRQNICAIVGLLLGGLIATPFFGINKTAGFIAMGAGVVIMYILLYTGLLQWLIRLIPESIRKFFRNFVRVMKFVVISALIVMVIVLVGGFIA